MTWEHMRCGLPIIVFARTGDVWKCDTCGKRYRYNGPESPSRWTRI